MNRIKKAIVLIVVILITSTTYGQDNVFDTKISLTIENQPIEEVLSKIHDKYPPIIFSYSSELLEAKRKVSLNYHDEKLQEILNHLFLKSDIEYLLINNTIALRKRSKIDPRLKKATNALPKDSTKNKTEEETKTSKTRNTKIDKVEPLTIRGRVLDEDGSSLPGASILVKGTTNGVISNEKGQYSIKINNPDNATLLFRFIGKKPIEAQVNGRNKINIVLPSISEALDEIVFVGYGTQRKRDLVGAIGSIKSDELITSAPASVDQMLEGKIAGLQVTTSSSEPGAKTEVRIRGVSSIDAVNSPLYIIDGVPYTTEIKMEIFDGFNMNPLANINPEDIESISVLKDAAATAIYGASASNGVILITTKSGYKGKARLNASSKFGYTVRMNNSYERLNTPEYVELMTEALINSGASEEEARQRAGRTDVNVNWPSLLYRTGLNQSYNLSASGGSDNFSYYTSVAYSSQKGIVKGNELNKMSMRVNLSHKIGDVLNVKYNISPTYMYKNNFSLLEEANILLPNIPIYDENGDYNSGIKYHPLAILNQNEDSDKSYRIVGAISASAKFLKHFTIDTKYGFDLYNNTGRTHYSMLNQTGSTFSGLGSRNNIQNINWYANALINYKNTIAGAHNIDWLVSGEAQKSGVNTVSAKASNFPNDKMRELSSASVYEYAGSRRSEKSQVSYFTRLSYNYNNRYYFTSSIRNDASSIFGGDVKSSLKGAVGFSWLISSEPFFSSTKKSIDFLKLRASYGTAGNSRIGTYASRGIYTYNGNAYNNNPGLGPLYASNPDLSWETSHIINVGFDFRAFSMLSGTIEGYVKNNYNLLSNTSVSLTSGFSRSTQNLGNSQNQGIEVSLKADWFKKKTLFNWNTNFTISFENSIYTELFQGNGRDKGTQIILEGESVSNFYLIRWAGVNPDNGEALWYDKDGNITNIYDRDNRVVIGSALPDFYGSLTNDFTYKSFSLRIYTTYTYGSMVYNSQRAVGETDGEELGTYNQNKSQLKRWQKPGDITDIPKIVFNNESRSADPSTRFLEDGSHLNIKNITLSYNLDKELCASMGIGSIRISGMVENVFIFSGLKSINSSAGKLSTYYPDVRTFLLTLNVGF